MESQHRGLVILDSQVSEHCSGRPLNSRHGVIYRKGVSSLSSQTPMTLHHTMIDSSQRRWMCEKQVFVPHILEEDFGTNGNDQEFLRSLRSKLSSGSQSRVLVAINNIEEFNFTTRYSS